MGTEREKWVDIARGFTIYLMVLGHCIQFATPIDYDYKENMIFCLIYGFHMPMFMIISGYLFWYTLNRYSLWKGIIAKLKGVMIPCAVWGFVTYLCEIIVLGYDEKSLWGYLNSTIYSNWFLWAVFYCSLYGFITKYVFHNHLLGYGILIFINFIMPDIGNYSGTRRMLPFFLLGMLLNRYKIFNKIKEKDETIIILTLGICYLITLKLHWIELITGTIGSACVILFFYHFSRRFTMIVLQKLGQVSISIYLFTGLVFLFWIKDYCRISESYRYLIKSSYVLGLSLGLTLAAFCLSKLFQKNRIVSRLFMGR